MTRKWLPLTAICLGTLMLLVDSTIVNTALPRMAVSLDTSFAGLQWVVDAYVVALACLVLGAGSLADAIGHRRMYGIGLVVFAAASLAAGLAPNAGVLIAARALQGTGAAGMLATTFALLNSAYAGRDREVAFGIWGAVSGLSAAVGPVLGGLLTQDVGWRSIFFVNPPVSALALVLTARFLSADRHAASRADVAGTVTFTLAAAALTFGLIRAHEQGWTSTTTLALFAVATAALAAFVGVEQRSTHPMLDLALFTRGSFVAVLVASLVVNFSALAYFTYISIWLQSVLGLSPISAGLVLLPLGVAGFVVSAAVGALGHGWPPRLVISAGMLLIGAAAVVNLVLVTATSTWTALLPGLVLGGAGVGLATPALAQSAMAAAPAQRAGMASGAVNAARQLGFAVGIALLGTVFSTRLQDAVTATAGPGGQDLAHALTSGQAHHVLATAPTAARPALDTLIHHGFAAGLDATFVVAAVAAVLAGLIAITLIRSAPVATSAEFTTPATSSPEGALR